MLSGMAGLKPGLQHVWGLSYSRRSGTDSRGPSAPTRPATAGRSTGPAQLSRPTLVTDDPFRAYCPLSQPERLNRRRGVDHAQGTTAPQLRVDADGVRGPPD